MFSFYKMPLTKKLLRDLYNKRVLIMALTIILAVAACSFVSLNGAYQDLDDGMLRYYKTTNLADFIIDVKKAPLNSLHALAQLPNIKQLQARINYNMMVVLPAKSRLQRQQVVPGVAISFEKQNKHTINQLELAQGKWFSANNAAEAIVVQQFAVAHHLEPGDWLHVRLAGDVYKIRIVGIAYSPEYVYITPPGASLAPDAAGYAVMFMPQQFLAQHVNLQSGYNQLLGKVYDQQPAKVTQTINQVAKQLDQYSVLSKIPISQLQSVQTFDSDLGSILVLSTFFPIIFLIVAGLVVNVLLTRIVAQQRVVIGTLKSLGVGNLELCLHYMCYGLFIGVGGFILGAGFGLGLGYLLVSYFRVVYTIPNLVFHVHLQVLIIGLLISVSTTLLGSINGAMKAIKLAPAEAMRPESPKKGGRIFIDHINVIWDHLSFQGKLVLRSIFRNKFRSLVTLASTLIATSLLLSFTSLGDSIHYLIDFQFGQVEHQQVTVSLRNPLGPQVLSTLHAIPGVQQVETQLSLPAAFKYGPYQKTTVILGLPADNSLYTPIDNNGHVLHVPYKGLVLSYSLANILHVNKGDRVKVKLMAGRRIEKSFKVTGLIKSYLGLTAYMNQGQLSRMAGNSWLVNQVLFKIHPSYSALFHQRVQQFDSVINVINKQHNRNLLTTMINQSMSVFIFIICLFAGAIAISCILNNSMVSLSERARDVATFSVLGMTRKEIFRLFFYEGLVLNIIGLILGLWFGVYMTHGLLTSLGTELMRFPYILRPIRFFEAGFLIAVFVMVSYCVVYRSIVKTNWLAVLNIRE